MVIKEIKAMQSRLIPGSLQKLLNPIWVKLMKLSGSLILRRVVSDVLINISPSNIFPIIL